MQVHEVIIYVAMLIVIQIVGVAGNVAIAKTTGIRALAISAVITVVALISLAIIAILLVLSFGW